MNKRKKLFDIALTGIGIGGFEQVTLATLEAFQIPVWSRLVTDTRLTTTIEAGLCARLMTEPKRRRS